MKRRLKVFWKRLLKAITKPEMQILPGQLAFFFVLSLIPLIALVGAVASLFSISIDSLVNLIQQSVPGSAANLLIPIISGKGINFNMIVFFVSTFILASNGTHSIIVTSNRLYKIKDSSYLRRRIKAIFMILILVILLIFILLVPAFGDFIFGFIRLIFHEEKIITVLYKTYHIVKYPLSILLIYCTIKLIYTLSPDKNIPSNTTTYGALFTTITWIVATEIYSIYVEVFAKYDLFYGSISNILILLLWVYVLSYVFVLGMAINSTRLEEKEQ